jgi:hypothetical protein
MIEKKNEASKKYQSSNDKFLVPSEKYRWDEFINTMKTQF